MKRTSGEFSVRLKTNMEQYQSNTLMAFIDILGFSAMLKKKSLNEIVELMNSIVRADNSSEYGKLLQINTKLISDSFIIWAQPTEAKHITAYFAYLGTVIGRIHKIEKIIARGYVANGNHFSDDSYWISPVFVESFKCESKLSVHPRVILGQSAINRIVELYPHFIDSGFLKRDDDWFRFVNYMMCISDNYQPKGDTIIGLLGGTGLEDALIAHKNNIEYGLSNFKSHAHKYYWLATYHNNHIKDYIRIKNKEKYFVNLDQA